MAVAMTVVTVAVLLSIVALDSPIDTRLFHGRNPASIPGSAITEPTALDSSFTERRTPQRAGLLLFAVVFAGVSWAFPSSREVVARRSAAGTTFGRPLTLRDRGPPRIA